MANKDVSIDIVAQDKTGAAFKSVKGNLTDLSTSVGAVTGKIAVLTGVLAAIGSAAQIKGLVDSADNMNKLSQKTGIAVSELSSLSNTADLAGVSNEQLGSALVKLNKSIAEAASGTKEQAQAFKNLGISVKDANGNIRPTADILGDVAGAFSNASDGAIKTQYAMALFGKAGADLIPFLNTGKQGIKEFGATFGEEFAQNAERFNDNLTKLNQQLQVVVVEGITPMLESMSKLIVEFQSGTKNSQSFLDAILNFGTINPFNTTAENLKVVREQIEENNDAIERYKRANSDTRSLEQYNTHLQNRLNYLKAIQKSEGIGVPKPEDVSGMDMRLLGISKPVAKKNLAPLITEKKAVAEVDKQLEQIKSSFLSVSDQILRLVEGEDDLLVRQFERITNDKVAIEQYKELLAVKRKILNQDKEIDEAIKTQQKLEEEAAKKKQTLADEAKKLFEQTRSPLEAFNIEMARLDMLLKEGYISWDVYSRATLDGLEALDKFKEKGKDSFEELKDAINGWGNEFTSVMADSVMSGKLSFKDLANSIIRDLLRIQIQKSITKPLIESGTSFLDGLLSGQRAMGGPVTAGNSYLVGENGPEIFTPGASGGITPNNQMSSGGVTVVQNINVTTGVQQTVRAEIMTLMPQIAGAAKAAVADAKLRGGNYAAALR